MKRLLFFLLVSSLISASCASRKASAPPTKPVPVTVVTSPVDTVKVAKEDKNDLQKSLLKVRLLLPLRLDEHFQNDTVPDQPLFYDNTTAALHFYLGAKAALDSLGSSAENIKVDVVDVSGDSLEVLTRLRTRAFKDADLAISLLPPNFQEAAAQAASASGCQLVLPGSSNTQLPAKKSNVWLATPANSTQLGMMCAYLWKENSAAEYIILTRKTRSENVLASFMGNYLDTLAGKKVARLLEFNKDTWEETFKSFPKTKKINLIIPTQDESYLQSVLNKLRENTEGYQIRLVGLPSWENFESVDPTVLADFDTHIFSALYIDVDYPQVAAFRKSFISANHADPLPQAYQAFDLVSYFANNHNVAGRKYEDYQPMQVMELYGKGMRFRPVCNGCGYENSGLNILKYGDFRLVKVAEFQR